MFEFGTCKIKEIYYWLFTNVNVGVCGNVMSSTEAFDWHKRFSKEREEVKDGKFPGRNMISRTEGNDKKFNNLLIYFRKLDVWALRGRLIW